MDMDQDTRGDGKGVKAADIRLGLRTAYPPPGWRVFYEVGNDTGTRVKRHADAVAIGIWPSSGHKIHGFEIKVSRSDFKAEMRDPTKSWDVMRFCHHWWMVTPPGLIKADELPDNWGWATYDGKTLRQVRAAVKLSPEAPTPGFMAALVRRAGEEDSALHAAAVEKARAQWAAAQKLRGTSMESWEIRELKSRAERAEYLLAGIKKKLPDLNEYNLDEYANLIKAAKKAGLGHHVGGIRGIINTMEVSARRLRELYTEAGFDLE